MSNLTSRTIRHYLPDEFTDSKPENLEDCVFTLKDGSHIDIGAMCYRIFDERENRTNIGHSYVKKTDISTLDTNRYAYLGNLIDHLRLNSAASSVSKRKQFGLIMSFVSWVGKNLPTFDITNTEHVKHAYQEYTKWLFHRIKLKDGDSLKMVNNSASTSQKIARIACKCMTGTSEKEIEYWAPAIRFSDRDTFNGTLTTNPISDDDKFKTYSSLCDFIHLSWSVLIEKTQTQIEFQNTTIDMSGGLNNLNKHYTKILVAALMTFIGASGSNLQVAKDAEVDSFEYDQTQKYVRLSGIKSRANNKTVHPEFASKYLSIWKKWLSIRELWLHENHFESDFAFPFLGPENDVISIPSYLLDATKPSPKFFQKNYGVRWITARSWRGFKSKLIGQVTNNDIFASAEMQSHNINTALRHYTNRNLADAAEEISSALNAVYFSAVDRTRFKPKINVPIVVGQNPNTMTAIGECTSDGNLKPSMAEGFTLFAPIPNCSIKETCIFCDKYAVHANGADIRKLLSLKFLINELGKTMPQDEWALRWAPYIFRIDEILTEIVVADPSMDRLIKETEVDIEYGNLDEFWLDYYETLSNLGVVA